ncbi:HD domain-containing protein [Aeropyrum camini]|uniref:5'-deoxynucleotidase n=1 Tax=Aeropyrum camini SY1 = JCM 12091 TaxID=1198449 RepID=U3TBN6_9CREN|nr:HD family hydrolase [Aeropyrum camini]BAN90952.1 predicted hydrolase HD superfamily [Aeropyrum camini SY1 = JCM 12091]
MKTLGDVLEALSSLSRTGWMLRGVPHQLAETVAEHLFAAAVIAGEMAWMARSQGLPVNPERAVAIALYHDMAESVIGDISRRAGLSREKRDAEARAFAALPVSEEAKKLYREFEEASTLEARIARVAELLATFWRSCVYVRTGFRAGDIGRGSLEEAMALARSWGLLEHVERLVHMLGGEGCLEG